MAVLTATLNRELLRAAERLTAEYSQDAEVPAGSVLRCYARAVRRLHVSGTPVPQLPERAEALTRRLLRQRGAGLPDPHRH